MRELLSLPYFGILLTILAYAAGMTLQKKTGHPLCNHMILAIIMIIAVLAAFDIPYETYYEGGSIINMMLGPATACLAIPVYRKIELLKKNWLPVLAGCAAGSATAICSIFLLSRLFGLDDVMTVSLLPKSVTTPIALSISQSYGGIPAITIAAVTVTGTGGNLIAPFLVKLFRVKDPVAAGLGIGAASHAMGTAKAIEMGETQGAMSSLAIGLCGIVTALFALLFPLFF